MTNLRKSLLVTGCVCLSFTLFSFTATNETNSQLGNAKKLSISQNSEFINFTGAAKTCKIVTKVWNRSCQVVFWEAIDWVANNVCGNVSPDSPNDKQEELNKLNQL